jgi:hypothetical protein
MRPFSNLSAAAPIFLNESQHRLQWRALHSQVEGVGGQPRGDEVFARCLSLFRHKHLRGETFPGFVLLSPPDLFQGSFNKRTERDWHKGRMCTAGMYTQMPRSSAWKSANSKRAAACNQGFALCACELACHCIIGSRTRLWRMCMEQHIIDQVFAAVLSFCLPTCLCSSGQHKSNRVASSAGCRWSGETTRHGSLSLSHALALRSL